MDRAPNWVQLTLMGPRGPLSYAEVVDLWAEDGSFRSFWRGQLREIPFDAYRWETPPVTRENFDRRFQCIVLDAPSLARRPDVASFAEHIEGSSDDVATFPNLGGDAMLVVPTPRAPSNAYVQIGVFTRDAPESQQDALWRAVALAMRERVGERPVWLSTAGDGVAWLHVRLDSRPKYYRHAPFKAM